MDLFIIIFILFMTFLHLSNMFNFYFKLSENVPKIYYAICCRFIIFTSSIRIYLLVSQRHK